MLVKKVILDLLWIGWVNGYHHAAIGAGVCAICMAVSYTMVGLSHSTLGVRASLSHFDGSMLDQFILLVLVVNIMVFSSSIDSCSMSLASWLVWISGV